MSLLDECVTDGETVWVEGGGKAGIRELKLVAVDFVSFPDPSLLTVSTSASDWG
jgi:hypothetical protein